MRPCIHACIDLSFMTLQCYYAKVNQNLILTIFIMAKMFGVDEFVSIYSMTGSFNYITITCMVVFNFQLTCQQHKSSIDMNRPNQD